MKRLIILPFLCLLLSGCNAVAVGMSAVTKTGVVVAQERSTGSAIDDFTIWTQIKNEYLKKDVNELLSSVSVEVIEGRVHLTGKVTDPATSINAVRLAWQPNGVREVINEIQVQDQRPLKDTIKEVALDNWIKAQLKGKLVVTENIHSLNYNVEVVNGTVYLMGIAQDTDELDTVTNIASTIKHVDRVISHVRLKADPQRG